LEPSKYQCIIKIINYQKYQCNIKAYITALFWRDVMPSKSFSGDV